MLWHKLQIQEANLSSWDEDNTGYVLLNYTWFSLSPSLCLLLLLCPCKAYIFHWNLTVATATDSIHILGRYEAVITDKPPMVCRLSLWKHSIIFPPIKLKHITKTYPQIFILVMISHSQVLRVGANIKYNCVCPSAGIKFIMVIASITPLNLQL